MIVPMKKVTLAVMEKSKDASLDRLRELGLLHIERKNVNSDRLTMLVERRTRVESAIAILHTYEPRDAKKGQRVGTDVVQSEQYVDQTLVLADERKGLQDSIFANNRELNRLKDWGDFDPADFVELDKAGVKLIPYELSKKSFEVLEIPVFVIHEGKDTISCVAVGEGLPGETPLVMPPRATWTLREDNDASTKKIAILDEKLAGLSAGIPGVLEEKSRLTREIEFETARAGMEGIPLVDGSDSPVISLISGYAPAPELGVLKRAAAENDWALFSDDPAEDDAEVPTLLKNNKFVELIYPLTDFLEMTPGYRETDISLWFLLFFTLFFGMIFGDAGYGILLFIISLTAICKTAKKGVPPVFKMLLLLSASNVVWGTLTCTWFAIDAAKLPDVLKNLSFKPISTVWTPQDVVNHNLMRFCFSIGLVHLLIAHVKAFFRKIRSLACLNDLGQILELIGMYYVILCLVVDGKGFGGVVQANLALGDFTLNAWPVWCLSIGFAFVFIFANYEGSILKSILASIANIIPTVLGITNVFSDIMSYIRLWAVGLAGASLAGTINLMAGPMLGSFLVFAGIILLVFGHCFNMVLNVLSVLVHGVRLNTLEFSTNIGLGWTGFAYKPFGRTW